MGAKKKPEISWYKENPKYKERFLASGRKTAREYRADYRKKKRASDPLYKARADIRIFVTSRLNLLGYEEGSLAHQLIGIPHAEAIRHLAQTAIDRYGTYNQEEDYHIDHIVPLATATNEDELKRLQHWTNLQLLKPIDNLRKGSN